MYALAGLTEDLAAAIQRMEGWAPGTLAYQNNNPGNLRAGPGQIGTDSRGFAIFPDYATGEAALERQVDLNIGRGLTLTEFFNGKPGIYSGYAPAADANDPTNYANTVARWLGIDPNSQLQNLSTTPDQPTNLPTDSTDMSPYLWGAAALLIAGMFAFD